MSEKGRDKTAATLAQIKRKAFLFGFGLDGLTQIHSGEVAVQKVTAPLEQKKGQGPNPINVFFSFN